MDNLDLHLNGKTTDNIWAMIDQDGLIGLRFDSGDSGVVYLTTKQAQSVIAALQHMVGMP